MINYDTIKSVYEDKLTLMQWLVKVQNALKDATAVSFNVNKTGDATLTFSILFDDGTELETAPIVLEQGESVESATLRNGHLILTLTNGDELDAGDMGAVSSFSIDANQHLIVTYQDGSTNDLGAIFTGNININGSITCNGLTTPSISGQNGGAIVVNNELRCLEKITDTQGRYRFFEITPGVPSAFDNKVIAVYNKASLSGSHLLIVFAGRVPQNAVIPTGALMVDLDGLPQWVRNKIATISPSYAIVDDVTVTLWGPNLENYGSMMFVLQKYGSSVTIRTTFDTYPVPTTSDGYFRFSFDLLIDLD